MLLTWRYYFCNHSISYGVIVLVAGGAVASWLVRSSLDGAVQVRALARDILGKTLNSHCAPPSRFMLGKPG